VTFVPIGPAPARVRILAFGEPSSGKSPFALSFPRPGVIDPTGNAARLAAAFPHALVSEVQSLSETRLELRGLGADSSMIDTLILDDFSTTYDRVCATYIGEPKHVYYEQRKIQTLALLRTASEFPGDIVITTRTKPIYGAVGDSVCGHTIGGDERIVIGARPDIDDALTYVLDLILEIAFADGRSLAIVRNSRIEGIAVGDQFEATYSALAQRLGRLATGEAAGETPGAPITGDPASIGDAYGFSAPFPISAVPPAAVTPVEDELPDEGAVGLAVAAIAEILPGGTRPKMGEPIHLRKAS
jgi:hypothetical protein